MSVAYRKDGIVLLGGEFISLDSIIEKCNNIKFEEENLVILEMGWDGRGGSVYEQRALPLKNALKIKEMLLDKEVYFGEIWGKHSEVCGTMCEKTFEIEKNKKKVKDFLKLHPSGVDYDYSFIETLIDRHEEEMGYSEDEDEEELINFLEELKSLL